jgi:gliding motility-associated-like protein
MSNLEFVENKGQWDSQVKFRAEVSTGFFILHRDGFTVLQNDTTDLLRIHKLLHGEIQSAVIPSNSGKTVAFVQPGSPGGKNYGKGGAAPGDGGGGPGGGVGAGAGSGTGSGTNQWLLHSQTYRVSFVGASDQVAISPEKILEEYNNYFVGAPAQWRPQARLYQGVVYKDLYPGIDLHYYSDGGVLKYDLVVHPGADPHQIVLRYQGQNKLSIKKGQLWVQTTVGTVKELEPRSYQLTAQGRAAVNCSYEMPDAQTVRFKIKDYSPDATLVIDPAEVFCTFTGSRSDNWGYTATYDNSGNFYVGGIVLDYPGIFSGSNFLTTPGAYQSVFRGGDGSEGTYSVGPGQVAPYKFDVAIKKFNTSGSAVLFATYLGGSGDEQPHSMICDPQGNLIVTGRTSSPDFPVFPSGATDFQGSGFDVFITKFNINGTGLIGSRRIGGEGADGVNYKPKYVSLDGTQELRLSYGDDGRGEVILDAANNIYVATSTQSLKLVTTPGAFQSGPGNLSGGQDGMLIKTSPDVSTVLGMSYLGGSGTDAAFVLALDPLNNNIYVAGGTLSTDFPGVGKGPAVSGANNGGADGFVSIISNDLSTLINSSYFGTSGTDMIYGIEFDKSGFPYITGTTTGAWAVTPGVGFSQPNGRQFISKLRPDLSGYVYSMTFGKGSTYPDISPTAFLVDRCENVYVAGWGGGIDQGEHYNNSRTNDMKTTANALQPTTDGDDFYFFVLQKNAASQLYGSYFGQPGGQLGDHVDGGTSRFDKQGVIYQSICANCYGPDNIFPTTPGAIYKHNGTGTQGCNEAAVKIKFDFAGVSAGLKLDLHGRGDSVGCIPLVVGMQDTVLNAKSYIWDFGDGSRETTTSPSLNHTYTAVGVYTVMLIGIDSNSCNVADTVFKTITVKNNPAALAFDITKLPPCTSFDYLFDNESTHTALSPPFTNVSFVWNFGDGTGTFPAGLGNTNHSYSAPGPYTVSLILVDTNYCNYPDTLAKPFYVAQNVKAQFSTPAFGCAPYTAVFNNTSIAGSKFYYDFGDGSPIDSVDVSPSHPYTNVGTYPVTLIAVDPNTCNMVDTFHFTVNVQAKPTAGFSFQPDPPTPNTPTIFTDASTPGIKYQWFFGDGATTTKATPDTVMHQYIKTDTFQVCLAVTNESGCTDTVCHPVAALINPLLDVPNAFTPGRFGQNGIVKVMGFGIVHLTFRIYNRWGQQVFESNSQYIGWDGTYRGTLQPMDVYGYTLEAEYSDGTRATKKGDITLIR